jgi:MFS family permease
MATLVLCDNVPPRSRPLYQSGIGAIYAIGSTCGASLGGIIAEHLSWRWNFFLAVPICIITILLTYIYVVDPPPVADLDCPLSPYERFRTIDVRGALLLVAGLGPLMAAVSLGGSERPWTDPLVLCFLIGGLVVLALFIHAESRARLPILPLKLLHGRAAVSNILTNFCASFAYFVVSLNLNFPRFSNGANTRWCQFLFMVPLYFQAVKLESAGTAGTRLIVPSVGVPLGSTLAGFIITHSGRLASLVRAGCFVLLIGVILPVTFGIDDADSRSWVYSLYLAPAAIGMGIFYPSALFSMLTAFQPGGKRCLNLPSPASTRRVS